MKVEFIYMPGSITTPDDEVRAFEESLRRMAIERGLILPAGWPRAKKTRSEVLAESAGGSDE